MKLPFHNAHVRHDLSVVPEEAPKNRNTIIASGRQIRSRQRNVIRGIAIKAADQNDTTISADRCRLRFRAGWSNMSVTIPRTNALGLARIGADFQLVEHLLTQVRSIESRQAILLDDRSQDVRRTKRMKVVLTGAAGVIGQAVREHLGERYEFVSITRNPADFSDLVADIRNFDAIRPAFDGADAVVHLAASISVDSPWESVLNDNLIGTYNVYEAARQAGVQAIVFASSNHTIGGYELDGAPSIYDLDDPRELRPQRRTSPGFALWRLEGLRRSARPLLSRDLWHARLQPAHRLGARRRQPDCRRGQGLVVLARPDRTSRNSIGCARPGSASAIAPSSSGAAWKPPRCHGPRSTASRTIRASSGISSMRGRLLGYAPRDSAPEHP